MRSSGQEVKVHKDNRFYVKFMQLHIGLSAKVQNETLNQDSFLIYNTSAYIAITYPYVIKFL